MDDADIHFDPTFTLPSTQDDIQNEVEDDFGDDFGDEIDLSELVQVTETVEQEYAANNISFVPQEGSDPTPPPILPENTESFHPLNLENLRTWIYPTNYPIRGYQYNIIQKAMFNNTLVALPTGLGKTFIAAVVMFNYWRWFPNSKIIFMAPTRPLVTQQIEACFTICGLPQEETVDMSGSTTPENRRELWKTKRVFFSTPQTVDNDLTSRSCPGEKISCVVVDEAHKATGNYAYVKVIRQLSKKNKHFRVLALTATPGSSLDTVQTVVSNLQITNIQIRTEDSMDVREYSHGKNLESIIVPLGYTEGSTGLLPRIIEEYTSQVFEPTLLRLSKMPTGVIPEPAKNPAFGLQMKRVRFQAQATNINNSMKYQVVSLFLVAEQMSRAYDLLCQHGIAPFLESLEGTRRDAEATMAVGKSINKAQSQFYNHAYITRIIPKLKQEMQKSDFIGHPKIDTLVGILLKHFTNLPSGEASKVMIFSSYRSSVTEICNVLSRHDPMIRPYHFVGQAEGKNGSKGLKQSEQQEVIRKFKNDEFNVIVCTSIGEEGLDIGEVDLIVCYDSQASPVRMLQRMGRTGRKRQGKCVLLMTETEEQKFKQAKETYEQVQRLITQGVHLSYYRTNPSVIPVNYKPTICRKRIEIGQYKAQPKTKSRGKVAPSSLSLTPDGVLTENTKKAFIRSFCNREEEYATVKQVIQKYWPKKSLRKNLGKQVPLQTKVKPSCGVGHSRRTLDFVELIAKMEHRILHPDEKIQFTAPKQQTRLMIPSKVNPPSSKLFLPPKRKPLDDNDQKTELAMFYDEHGDITNGENAFETTNFLNDIDNEDFAESSTKRSVKDFFAPRKKAKLNSSSKTSNKSSSLASISNDDFPDLDDLLDLGFDFSNDKSKDVDRPKGIEKLKAVNKGKGVEKGTHVEDEFITVKNKKVDKGKAADRGLNHVESISNNINLENNHDNSANVDMLDTSDPFEPLDDFNIEDDWEPMLPESVFDAVEPIREPSQKPALPESPELRKETIENDPPQDKSVTILDMDELYNIPTDEEDFDYGDFPLGELISKNLAAWESIKASAFDETIPPLFPFEKDQSGIIDKITVLWPQNEPRFSKKASGLLGSRQKIMEQNTGSFLTMKIVAKLNNKSFSSPPSFLLEPPAPQINTKVPHTIPQPLKTNSNHPIRKNSPPPATTSPQIKAVVHSPEIFEIQDDDDDFEMNDSFLQHAAELVDEVPKEDAISIVDSQSDVEEGFDSIVYEGGEFENLFESQNEVDELPNFSFVEQQFVSQKYDHQMKKSAALYGPSSLVSEDNEERYEDPLDSSQPVTLPTVHGSPLRNESTLLQNLSKGLHSPSPLRNTPTLNRLSTSLIGASESDEEDIILRRKRRSRLSPVLPIQRTKKRLRQKGTPKEDEDDGGVIMYEGMASKVSFMERIKQCQSPVAAKHRPKKTNLVQNPFFDVEAEKSSDEGHTTDEETEDGGSSLLNSFIDDENSNVQEATEKSPDVDVYRQNLFEEERPKKHWMNRFNADKWLNAEEDSIIEGDEEDEEDEQEGSGVIAQEIAEDDDDDDFA
ncbi:uncharacterized protein EV154DRAFT_482526 [Mucor mucedo]|uniref:uncharacterized protein n=1 Tax=Mucor mucedo TaxID=29922 RepID=UPI0022210996|nr:uncharacterized protein EV154DRAFT_482526 [Mucor mucedo]KAI7890103.1 hypothetical protein EV154DRAFT_482526 [Mucor mucedo]